jgi:hypothetical protein
MPRSNSTVAADTVEEIVPPQREEFDATSDITGAPTPTRRRGRPPGSKNRSTSARATGNLEDQIGGLLVLVNAPLQLIPPLAKDALDPTEIQALSKAVALECERNATFKKYVLQALKAQGSVGLIGVVALIAGRRAIRHNILPIPPEIGGNEGADAALGFVISTMASGKPFNPIMAIPVPEPAPVG